MEEFGIAALSVTIPNSNFSGHIMTKKMVVLSRQRSIARRTVCSCPKPLLLEDYWQGQVWADPKV